MEPAQSNSSPKKNFPFRTIPNNLTPKTRKFCTVTLCVCARTTEGRHVDQASCVKYARAFIAPPNMHNLCEVFTPSNWPNSEQTLNRH